MDMNSFLAISPKKLYKWQRSTHEKVLSTLDSLRKCKSEQEWGTTTRTAINKSTIKQKAGSVEEDVKKLQP